MLFVVALEPVENLHRLFHGRLGHFYPLKPPTQRLVAIERALVFLVGGRSDASQLARSERGLQQVGGVHRGARRRAGAHDGVDLVDEEHDLRVARRGLDHGL
jgi:hypothetical protein